MAGGRRPAVKRQLLARAGNPGALYGVPLASGKLGPIALVHEGDTVEIDIPGKRLTLQISEEEMARRGRAWQAPPPKVAGGYLGRYAASVTSAGQGAVLKD